MTVMDYKFEAGRLAVWDTLNRINAHLQSSADVVLIFC